MLPSSASEPGRSHHAVRSFDIIFDQYRDAMQRAARTFCFALLIESPRDCERVRIRFDHCAKRRAGTIHCLYARQVFLHQRFRRILLQLRDGSSSSSNADTDVETGC